MELSTFKDYMNSFIGIFFLVLPIYWEIKKKGKNYIRNVIILSILCVILFFLGLDKIHRDKAEKDKNDLRESSDSTTISQMGYKISHVDSSMNNLLSQYKKDTASFSEFVRNLQKVGYTRNPETNQPTIYNTKIDRAENVKIGGN
jgi:hypothetical protein